MKRIISAIIAMVFLLSLAACGSTENGDTKTEPKTSAAQQENGTTQADSAETEEDTKSTEEEQPSVSAEEFQEVIVVEQETCLWKITGIEEENLWGYTLKAYLENNSSDKTYMFSVTSASVNGVQYDPYFAAEVAPQKKSNESISFSDVLPDDVDIGPFTHIRLNVRIYDSDDWLADEIAQTTVDIYPMGQEQATVYERPAQDTDTVLAENENVAIIVTGYREDSIWGYCADLYIQNKSDKNLVISADDVSVNGFMIDPFWVTSVEAGTSHFSSISWYTDDLEENGITLVEDISMTLRVYDDGDWMADDIINEVVTLNP